MKIGWEEAPFLQNLPISRIQLYHYIDLRWAAHFGFSEKKNWSGSTILQNNCSEQHFLKFANKLSTTRICKKNWFFKTICKKNHPDQRFVKISPRTTICKNIIQINNLQKYRPEQRLAKIPSRTTIYKNKVHQDDNLQNLKWITISNYLSMLKKIFQNLKMIHRDNLGKIVWNDNLLKCCLEGQFAKIWATTRISKEDWSRR